MKTNFFNIFKSLNPFNYIELSNNRISTVLKYFLFMIVFCVTMLFIISIPKIYSISEYISGNARNFDTLSVSSSLQVSQSFNLLSHPLIIVESNNNKTLDDELFIINSDELLYKKYFLFGKSKSVPLDRSVDFVNSASAQRLLVVGMIFLLPSILFWSVVFWTGYFIVILFFTYLLVMMASGSLRIDASAVHLFKMSIYATTVLVLSQIVMLPFYSSIITPIALYWLFITCIIFLWYDNPPGRGGSVVRNRSDDDSSSDSSYGSKSRDIFGSSKSSSGSKSGGIFGSKSSSKQDSYDVDEHGNLKSSSKRKKSFDNDNDGYVEL
jgi:hypothetical protein